LHEGYPALDDVEHPERGRGGLPYAQHVLALHATGLARLGRPLELAELDEEAGFVVRREGGGVGEAPDEGSLLALSE